MSVCVTPPESPVDGANSARDRFYTVQDFAEPGTAGPPVEEHEAEEDDDDNDGEDAWRATQDAAEDSFLVGDYARAAELFAKACGLAPEVRELVSALEKTTVMLLASQRAADRRAAAEAAPTTLKAAHKDTVAMATIYPAVLSRPSAAPSSIAKSLQAASAAAKNGRRGIATALQPILEPEPEPELVCPRPTLALHDVASRAPPRVEAVGTAAVTGFVLRLDHGAAGRRRRSAASWLPNSRLADWLATKTVAYYTIECCGADGREWAVARRFNEFAALRDELQQAAAAATSTAAAGATGSAALVAGAAAGFPSKARMRSGAKLRQDRQVAFDAWLNGMLVLCSSSSSHAQAAGGPEQGATAAAAAMQRFLSPPSEIESDLICVRSVG